MNLFAVTTLLLFVTVLCHAGLCEVENPAESSNLVEDPADDGATRKAKADDVLWDMWDNCAKADVQSVPTCLKLQVLQHFNYDVSRIATPRSLSDNGPAAQKIDRLIVKRVGRYLKSREFKFQLPEFLFQGATLVFDPKKSIADFDIEIPAAPQGEDRSMSAARDMVQQKALLPLLMMLKMKLKLITPILLTLVSIKATKAYVMSKLALLLVSFFMASQVFKKLGMILPMMQPPPTDPMASMGPMSTPASVYGAQSGSQPASSYGPSSGSASGYGSPSQGASAYGEPAGSAAWEPATSSSNSYAKIWDAQQLAYNAYYKSAAGSPSLSSSASSSSSS